MKKQSNPMWGGHFVESAAEVMQQINASINVDKALYAQDIAGSLAHVQMLGDCGIITHDEVAEIANGLHQIKAEIEAGQMQWRDELEDIHMHIESRLKEIIGEVAGKLHTARSRNDQVATDFRLYVRWACERAITLITQTQSALITQAEAHIDTITIGLTHLQPAQPISFAHHLMAYVEMLQRDKTRFLDAKVRLNECPLGSAALAGTGFNINRHQTASALGFAAPTRNSLDSVGSRDFALEYLSASVICATNLSKLAEELVLWTSPLVNFIKLPESYTSGSSIMPQKRNPDAAELVRAKTGRMAGNLQQLLMVVKGTPLAYNKDLQEDKEPVFDTALALDICLQACAGMIAGMEVNKAQMLKAAELGHSTATDLADFLVRELNIPFRNAHHITGRLVRMAEEAACQLWELSLVQMQSVESNINEGVYGVLSVENSVASRKSYGGTAFECVKAAITQAKIDYLDVD
jgi:argininosuccinate lyase